MNSKKDKFFVRVDSIGVPLAEKGTVKITILSVGPIVTLIVLSSAGLASVTPNSVIWCVLSIATAQIAVLVIVSAFIAPLHAGWVYKRNQ